MNCAFRVYSGCPSHDECLGKFLPYSFRSHKSFMLLCATLQNPFCRKHFRSHSRSQFQRVFFPVVARNSKIRTCPLSTFVARKHNAFAANRIETLAFMARYTTLRNPPQSQSFRLPVFKPGLRSAQLLEQQKGNNVSVWSWHQLVALPQPAMH